MSTWYPLNVGYHPATCKLQAPDDIRVSGEILFDNDSEEMLMFKTAAEAYEHVGVLKRNGALKDHFLTDVEVDYMIYAN